VILSREKIRQILLFVAVNQGKCASLVRGICFKVSVVPLNMHFMYEVANGNSKEMVRL